MILKVAAGVFIGLLLFVAAVTWVSDYGEAAYLRKLDDCIAQYGYLDGPPGQEWCVRVQRPATVTP